MTKKTLLLLSLLCWAPLALQAMDKGKEWEWRKEEKAQREKRRQQEVTKGLEQIKRSVNAQQIVNPAALMRLVECTRPLDRPKAITRINAFIKSKELKELAGPVPHGDDPTDLELCALYLQEFQSLQETCLAEQPELVNQAVKLGTHIISLRKTIWMRHQLDPHQHYVDLIKNAYAHLEIAAEEK